MLEAKAKARLRLESQAYTEPRLTDQELDDILAIFARTDADGLLPDDPSWTGTWDLRGAIRKAWLIKAGKVAGEPSFAADGSSYQLSDIYQHCMGMAAKFAQVGTISTTGAV